MIVILVGDTNVGKTLLLNRYVKGVLPKISTPTVGVEYKLKEVTLSDNTLVKANIWDTAGQERYRSIVSVYIIYIFIYIYIFKYIYV